MLIEQQGVELAIAFFHPKGQKVVRNDVLAQRRLNALIGSDS